MCCVKGRQLIEVRCFDSFEKAAFLRNEVNALNRASARPDPFSTFEFYQNFFRHDEDFPNGQDLCLWFLAAFDADRLIGYIALKQVAQKVFGVKTYTLGFLVTHDTDRPHLVAKAEDLQRVSEAFYAYILSRKKEWSFLEFQQQDAASPLFPPPAALDLKNYLVREWPSMENGTIHLKWNTLAEYFKALSRNSRTNLRRLMRRLFDAGEVEFVASAHPATALTLFELYRLIEPHSWKSKAQADIGRHPERIEYFKGLFDSKQPMRVSIQVLLLDGIPIAGLITGTYLKGLYALHIVYDERVSRLAPGSAMLLMAVRQAIEGRFAFFNLLSGFSYYKLRWLAQMTETRIVQIYRKGSILFWRRVFGDWKRRHFSAKKAQAPVLFNPTRRDVSGEEATEVDNKIQLEVSAEERRRIAELIHLVRQGEGEFLSAAELIAAMPFDKQPGKPGKVKRVMGLKNSA
ncbi:MAG: GNAT family N-acetyltransferase [Gammaproteobacteria bacterium]|nr:GNAT family N-acetyltransferase [Gammaproteobacteria bacterium]